MKLILRYGYIFFFVTILFVIVSLIYKILSTDFEFSILSDKSGHINTGFEIKQYLAPEFKNNITKLFPYNSYVDSADIFNIKNVLKDLDSMDKFTQDSSLNRDLFTSLLTEKLENKIENSLILYNPDSLIYLLQWADGFYHFQKVDSKNERFYRRVNRFWFNLISNKLGQFAETDPSIKYNVKFKYMVELCRARMFYPPIGNSNSEKVLNYFLEGKYSYLFQRLWYGTNIFFKFIILFGIGLCFYSLHCVYKVNFK
jgi:hypothetical protein